MAEHGPAAALRFSRLEELEPDRPYARRGWLVVPLVLSPRRHSCLAGAERYARRRLAVAADAHHDEGFARGPCAGAEDDARRLAGCALAAKAGRRLPPQDLIEKIAGPEARKALYAVLPEVISPAGFLKALSKLAKKPPG